MNRLEINPNNEKYYSKEFIQGYKCGTKCQFDADVKVLEQVRQEIEQLYMVDTIYEDVAVVDKADVLRVIDKYKEDQE